MTDQPPQPAAQVPGTLPAPPAKLPAFVTAFTIADLVFCSLRLILAGFSAIGFAMMEKGSPLYPTAGLEVISGLGIALFGIPGNIMVLLKKPGGIPLCYLNVASTVLSLIVGVWQATILVGNTSGGAETVGALFGGMVALVVRAILLVLYIAVVRMAQKHFSEAPSQRPYALLG
jgi:hypothetical protein